MSAPVCICNEYTCYGEGDDEWCLFCDQLPWGEPCPAREEEW